MTDMKITKKELNKAGGFALLGLFIFLMFKPFQDYMINIFDGNLFIVGLLGALLVLYLFDL